MPQTTCTAYHVTPADTLATIEREGLRPRVGPRARLLGEPGPAIYLFEDRLTAEDAVTNWLGEAFDEDVALSLLEVTLDAGLRRRPDLAMGGELVVIDPIPATAIRVIGEV
jgi:hypothetical protein